MAEVSNSNELSSAIRHMGGRKECLAARRLIQTLAENGHADITVDALSVALAENHPLPFHWRVWEDLKEVREFGKHIFVTTAIFLLISLAAVAVEIYLHTLQDTKYASTFLVHILEAAKYIILVFDIALLLCRLTHHFWVYARTLKWK